MKTCTVSIDLDTRQTSHNAFHRILSASVNLSDRARYGSIVSVAIFPCFPSLSKSKFLCDRVNEVYRAATTSLDFMSMVIVHPEVPRNSNGAVLGARR